MATWFCKDVEAACVSQQHCVWDTKLQTNKNTVRGKILANGWQFTKIFPTNIGFRAINSPKFSHVQYLMILGIMFLLYYPRDLVFTPVFRLRFRLGIFRLLSTTNPIVVVLTPVTMKDLSGRHCFYKFLHGAQILHCFNSSDKARLKFYYPCCKPTMGIYITCKYHKVHKVCSVYI